LRKLTYAEVRSAGIGSQAAQHVVKKVADAYTTLRANVRAGNYGQPGSKRRRQAGAKPVTFRPDAAQPYDQRNLSIAPAARAISLWTLTGRLKDVPFACSPEAARMLGEHKRGEAGLLRRDGTWYLVATLDVPAAEQFEPDGFLGVDLGIVNSPPAMARSWPGASSTATASGSSPCGPSCRRKAPRARSGC
jgi:hypothetical protein